MDPSNLTSSLQQMTQNFLSYENQLIDEASMDFRTLFESTVKEVIEELFLSELSRLSLLKREIASLNSQLQQKQRVFSSTMDLLLEEMQPPGDNEENCEFFKEIADLKTQIQGFLADAKKEKKTLKKEESETHVLNEKTPKVKNKSFFSQRPRAANILFMEKRLGEMFPMGLAKEKIKDFLKVLLEEWRILPLYEKEVFEKEAEDEFVMYMQI